MRLSSLQDVLANSRSLLDLPPMQGVQILDEPLIAASIRRLAAYACPCSTATLRSTLRSALDMPGLSDEQVTTRIERAIEALHTTGDLLELENVTSGEVEAKGTWTFVAPPSFVHFESSKRLFLFGMSRDDVTPLPEELRKQVLYDGYLRVLKEPEGGEKLAQRLADIGWRKLRSEAWLRVPKAETAVSHREKLNTKLSGVEERVEIVEGLQVLDRQNPRQPYRDLWVLPKGKTGRFVCRRPQQFGPDMWGYAELQDGRVKRILDFPLPRSAERGCDSAWRAQLAIESLQGVPQSYRFREAAGYQYLDFFYPLPLWVQRWLNVTAHLTTPFGSLMSYQVEPAALAEAETFLRDRVWLARQPTT